MLAKAKVPKIYLSLNKILKRKNNYKKQIQDVNVTQQIKNMTLTIMSTFIEDGYLLENMEQLIVLINNKFIDYQNKYLDTNKIDFFKVFPYPKGFEKYI